MTSGEAGRRADAVLTWRRHRILQFLKGYAEHHGHPPSLREIGEAAGLAASSVSYHLTILEEHGYLTRGTRQPRTCVVRSRSGSAVSPGADAVPVPMVGRVAAGVPLLAEEMAGDTFWLPGSMVGGGTLFMLAVAGDSMTGAGINDGDLVVVRQQPTAEDGETVAAMVTDGAEAEATVKTLQRAGGHVWLMPQNPRYQPVLGDHAIVLGKVVAVLRLL